VSGGFVSAEHLRCSLLKLAVTLLQMSHRAACSNTQHCLKLLACYCTSVSTGLLDMTDFQVIVIALTEACSKLGSGEGKQVFRPEGGEEKRES